MAKSKNQSFILKKFLAEVGCYPNCRGGIDNKISCEKFMKIGPVKSQSCKTAMAGQIGLSAILNSTPNLTGIWYKAKT